MINEWRIKLFVYECFQIIIRVRWFSAFVMTAAARDESSSAWYCEEGNCLGDEFSITWMEHMDKVRNPYIPLVKMTAWRALLSFMIASCGGRFRITYPQWFGQTHDRPYSVNRWINQIILEYILCFKLEIRVISMWSSDDKDCAVSGKERHAWNILSPVRQSEGYSNKEPREYLRRLFSWTWSAYSKQGWVHFFKFSTSKYSGVRHGRIIRMRRTVPVLSSLFL